MTPGLKGHIKEYLRTRPDYEVAEFMRDVAKLAGEYVTDDELIGDCEVAERVFANWLDNYDPTPEVAPVK